MRVTRFVLKEVITRSIRSIHFVLKKIIFRATRVTHFVLKVSRDNSSSNEKSIVQKGRLEGETTYITPFCFINICSFTLSYSTLIFSEASVTGIDLPARFPGQGAAKRVTSRILDARINWPFRKHITQSRGMRITKSLRP